MMLGIVFSIGIYLSLGIFFVYSKSIVHPYIFYLGMILVGYKFIFELSELGRYFKDYKHDLKIKKEGRLTVENILETLDNKEPVLFYDNESFGYMIYKRDFLLLYRKDGKTVSYKIQDGSSLNEKVQKLEKKYKGFYSNGSIFTVKIDRD